MEYGDKIDEICTELQKPGLNNFSICHWELVKKIGLNQTFLLQYFLFLTQRKHSGLHERNDGWVYQAREQVAKDIDFGRFKFERARKKLKESNLLEVKNKPKSNGNLYRVNKEAVSKLLKRTKKKDQKIDFEEPKKAQIPF